ncbi:hypothetical protein CO655_21465 [Rhizobium sp. M1]|nr:hypothetical protein CO655_21465 [Rhizobium sp. M1]
MLDAQPFRRNTERAWRPIARFAQHAGQEPTCSLSRDTGIAGTTLTVMALTIRACRNLADRYRAGQL